MSLKELQLPPMIIADLYKKSLVELHGNKEDRSAGNDITKPNTTPVGFLGNNSRNVLIFVEYPLEQYLPAEQLDFLIVILKACQLNIGDIAIVNLAKAHPTLPEIIKQLLPSSILLFGIDPSPIPYASQPAHFEISLVDGIQVIGAPELEQLNQKNNESRVLKTKLWNSLKRLFNV